MEVIRTLQRRVTGSRLTLPVVFLYAVAVWLACGLVDNGWWLQFGAYSLTTYLMLLLNNRYALIRIYSRMVSCTFLVLSCCACFLFPSLRGAWAMLWMAACYLALFQTFQDRSAPGVTFYAFLFLGMATLSHPLVLWLAPLFWLMMATHLMSLSWRNWFASLLGLVAPYWFVASWLFSQGDLPPLADHLSALTDISRPFCYDGIGGGQLAATLLVTGVAVTGAVHFLRRSYADKIRTRMFYYIFMWSDLLAALLLVAWPRHADMLLRVMILNTSPLFGHFLTLTSTKITNIAFLAVTATALLLTVYNVWSL